MIVYQEECWADYHRDCEELWLKEYEETASHKDRMPLCPNVDQYVALERLGILRILTARDAGKLAGYVLTLVMPHMHHATVLCGFVDTFYLAKPYRKGKAFTRLLAEAESRLQKVGVQKVMVMTAAEYDMEEIFRYMGYKCKNISYEKWIGN